jgi:hypothetical protein
MYPREYYGAHVAQITLSALAISIVSLGVRGEEFHLRMAVPAASAPTCGVESLYMCARAAGYEGLTLERLMESAGDMRRGVTAAALVDVARENGIDIAPLRIHTTSLLRMNTPAILHVNRSHFIAFLTTCGERLVLFDTAIGLFDCTEPWFARSYEWEGAALLVDNHSRFAKWHMYLCIGLGLSLLAVGAAGRLQRICCAT